MYIKVCRRVGVTPETLSKQALEPRSAHCTTQICNPVLASTSSRHHFLPLPLVHLSPSLSPSHSRAYETPPPFSLVLPIVSTSSSSPSKPTAHQVALSSKLTLFLFVHRPDSGLPLHSLVSPRLKHNRPYLKLIFDYAYYDTRFVYIQFDPLPCHFKFCILPLTYVVALMPVVPPPSQPFNIICHLRSAAPGAARVLYGSLVGIFSRYLHYQFSCPFLREYIHCQVPDVALVDGYSVHRIQPIEVPQRPEVDLPSLLPSLC